MIDQEVFKLIRKRKGFEVNANQKSVFLSNECQLMKFLRMLIYEK